MKRWITVIFAQQALGASLPDVVDFNDHVQPILSEFCYHCHGPDSATRAPKSAPLRLDREEFAFEERDGKPVIIKGDPEKSSLIKRITTKDEDDIMPPPESHKPPLDAYQIALLSKWIEQGAPYEEHWSFIKPVKPTPPESKWGNNAIDAFISAKHQEHNLVPNAPADTHRIIRRLSFDITGLPPTPEQIKSFQEAAAMDLATAVQLAASEMLGTRAYAENFARHWLDAARYADSHGIHIDNYRDIWPYRDWVIKAFAENKSYRDFTIEQIAGDLLPNPKLDQIVATGFNRCLPTTGEGGAISKEYEAIYAKDQVETTSAIWLGLTTGCAACHDHKFDPISQKDFYALTAYFRNTTMAAMDRNKADHPPNIFVPLSEDRDSWESLKTQIAQADQAISQRKKSAHSDFNTWLTSLTPEDLANLATKPDLSLPLTVADKKLTLNERTIDATGPTVPFDSGHALQLKGTNIDLGDLAQFEARDQVTYGGYFRLGSKSNGPVISRMDTGNSYRGWDIWVENDRIGSHLIDQWDKNGIKAMSKDPLPMKKWLHIMFTYDGKAEPKKSLKLFVDGKEMPLKYSHSGKVNSFATNAPLRLGGRHPSTALNGDASFHSFQLYKRILTPAEISDAATNGNISNVLATPIADLDEKQRNSLYQYYIDHLDPRVKELASQKEKLLAQQSAIKNRGSLSLVMEEKKTPAIAHILERGEYTLEKEKVTAAIPELFTEGPSTAAPSRKELAEWLVSKENPLTARVTVNRMWYYFFGRGLVETTEDFGIMGARPTHPELLDWLAVEFMESNWDLQHIIRLITSSATYQLSDQVTSSNREKDPTNLYLARSPRHRLDAEHIRDMALASSGLLVPSTGGPPVKPYQPEGVWEAVAMNESNTRFYKQDSGDKLYRRSLYTFWKRTAPHPAMEILNAPTREVFCVRRDLTNTPLQAFVTLNDPQFVEASRHLAANAIKASESFDHRLDHLTQLLLGRRFENDERTIVKNALAQISESYQAQPELAKELIAVGASPVESTLQPQELASWTLIASKIFNLDETLTK
ncbi:MAG: DUF1553 domain-containing protein [Verrucomicrobiaceae bacterium]